MTILITGGAGFIGSNIATRVKQALPAARIVCMDNLRRRGSETNIAMVEAAGAEFIHGDIRNLDDFPDIPVDIVIECSADPSVLSGYGTSPAYTIQTNLVGTANCLEFCRRKNAGIVFLSTSRVYSVGALVESSLVDDGQGFRFSQAQEVRGVSGAGISEDFPILGHGPRSIYGTTKAASEMLCEEFRAAYGIPVVIFRFGVVAGPGQMARPDQGIFAYWMLRHMSRSPLKYIGFGGSGKQSRDVLHVSDLCALMEHVAGNLAKWDGATFNVGGGRDNTLSLLDATRICREICGNHSDITGDCRPRPMDIPCYYTDNARILAFAPEWRPRISSEQVLVDIHAWLSSRPDIVSLLA